MRGNVGFSAAVSHICILEQNNTAAHWRQWTAEEFPERIVRSSVAALLGTGCQAIGFLLADSNPEPVPP